MWFANVRFIANDRRADLGESVRGGDVALV